MYSFLSKKYLYSTKLKKDRKKDRGRDSKTETLFWLITHVITIFDALLAGRKSGRKLQCLRANPVTNNLFFSNIDFAQRMNRKLFAKF